MLGTSVSQSVIVSVLRFSRSGNWVLIPDMKERVFFSPQTPDQFIVRSVVIQLSGEVSMLCCIEP